MPPKRPRYFLFINMLRRHSSNDMHISYICNPAALNLKKTYMPRVNFLRACMLNRLPASEFTFSPGRHATLTAMLDKSRPTYFTSTIPLGSHTNRNDIGYDRIPNPNPNLNEEVRDAVKVKTGGSGYG